MYVCNVSVHTFARTHIVHTHMYMNTHTPEGILPRLYVLIC